MVGHERQLLELPPSQVAQDESQGLQPVLVSYWLGLQASGGAQVPRAGKKTSGLVQLVTLSLGLEAGASGVTLIDGEVVGLVTCVSCTGDDDEETDEGEDGDEDDDNAYDDDNDDDDDQ